MSSYTCAETNCVHQKTFSFWARIRKHYRSFHLNSVSGNEEQQQEPGYVRDIELPDNENFQPVDQNDMGAGLLDEDENGLLEPIDFKSFLAQESSKLITHFYRRPSLPRSLVQLLLDNVGNFLEISVEEFRKRFEIILGDLTNRETEKNSIHGMLNDFSNSFSSLSSEYLRLKFLERTGHLIPIYDYKVGERYEFRFINNRIVRVVVDCQATFIPLR